jgi:hypothetical protein
VNVLIVAKLLKAGARMLARLRRYWSELAAGAEEARAMAMRYRDLAALSDHELAARGLVRQDIPRAVLSGLHGAGSRVHGR